MIRNDKNSTQINQELLELLGEAYNPEFGIWVEQESKNPIYYPNYQAPSIQTEQIQIDEPMMNDQSSFPIESQPSTTPSNIHSNDENSSSFKNNRSENSNRLFMNAINSTNSDRKSPNSENKTSYNDRKSASSNRNESASERLRSKSTRNRSKDNRAPRLNSRSSRSPIKEISIKSSKKTNSEILSRLGKPSKVPSRIEKSSNSASSPLQAKIKGLAGDSGNRTGSKKNVLDRLGARVEPKSTSNSGLNPDNPNSQSQIHQKANFLKQALVLGQLPNNSNFSNNFNSFGYPVNNLNQNTNISTSMNNLPENLYGLKRTKCSSWPLCNLGNDCPYFHPTKICPNFPNCPLPSSECMYIHPSVDQKIPTIPGSFNLTLNNKAEKQPTSLQVLCKFGVNCLNPNCQFVHPIEKSTKPDSALLNIRCKFYPNCMNTACPYQHPENNSASLLGASNPAGDSAITSTNGSATVSAFGSLTNQVTSNTADSTNSQKLPGSLCDPARKVPFPCRNGKDCPRLDCHFMHPHEPTSQPLPCKFGHYCTRTDCLYSHPTRNISLVLNNSDPNSAITKSTTGIENRLDHISDRPFASSETSQINSFNDGNQIPPLLTQPNSSSENSAIPNFLGDSSVQSQLQKNSQLVLEASMTSMKDHDNNELDHSDDVIMSL
ncbi:Nuclear polyadenylated RNA-binding protein NAB2 [Smittium culicis]|uniref:Nuclear polyadenylated RNA-binding protein NAB2 n=2 Tax=Smittium culicis TaxID=133412 RepID=A0A1R1Y055_9FUNG|nr:Nuclear polyadenylated RNA-binding protein NAB2 [Smittium culicis]